MRRIIYSPEAKADIAAIGGYIAEKASEMTAEHQDEKECRNACIESVVEDDATRRFN